MSIEIKMFSSPTCGPCKMMKPLVETLAKENEISFTKICIVEHPEIAKIEEIQYVPTIKIYKDGELKEVMIGMKSKQALQLILDTI